MKKDNLFLIIFLILGFLLRIINLNWDNGHFLHPDDRFMTMVTSDISLPQSIGEYFSQESPLNPASNNYNFYVYGNFPLLIIKSLALVFNLSSPSQINLLGRVCSATYDTFTVLIVYLLAKYLLKNKKTALISAFFYTTCVFSIQQGHFFTVDSLLVFLSTLSVYFFISKRYFLSAIIFGLCLSTKSSLIYVAPIFIIFLLIDKQFLKSIYFTIITILIFRIFQPYAFSSLFTFSPAFIKNSLIAKNMITGVIDYPPIFQWFKTIPLIYPLQNIYLFGLGPGLGLLVFLFFTRKQKYNSSLLFVLVFCFLIFIYQGVLLAKFMRYFYPIYPFLCIFAGSAFYHLKNFNKSFFFLLIIAWPVCFLSIYFNPHPRIAAANWLAKNITKNSVVSYEYWDDPLNVDCQMEVLKITQDETSNKWQVITQQLKNIDFLIISSNRMVSSLPRLSSRFPETTRFYQDLFANRLGFKKIAQFQSFPLIPDFIADESFTVYDHPQVYIFKKIDKRLVQ